MKKLRYILVIVLCSLMVAPVYARKKEKKGVISAEQEQQFTYYWYAAKEAITQERYEDAYVLLEFCNTLNPNDAQTLYYLGVMYQSLGKDQEAQEVFERAYNVQKGLHSEELLNRLGQIYVDQKNWKKALTIQDELDKVNGYDAMSAITRYRIYASAKQPKKAIQAIDKYIETDPDNLRFLLFRIDILEYVGVKAKVLYEAYERVLELDPYNLRILNNYAYHLATHGGDLTKAERMSALTIREEPDSPVYLDTYGWILHLQGQDQLALFYLNKALRNAALLNLKTNEIEAHIHSIE